MNEGGRTQTERDTDHGERCRTEHEWVAFFFESGRLAYWQCRVCGRTDRGVEALPERLGPPPIWGEPPPRPTATGASPPAGTRRWAVPDGCIPVEGDPSTTDFEGDPIPGLPEAHSYARLGEGGEVLERYEPGRLNEGGGKFATLTRYQVIGDALVRFVSHCYEESTFDIPHAGEPKETAVLSGLKPLDA